MIPTGEIAPVKGTPLDFTTPALIGERADQLTGRSRSFDNNYVINGGGGSLVLAARARDPQSGRVLEVRTTQPGIQLYTGNRSGFALETQHFPRLGQSHQFPLDHCPARRNFQEHDRLVVLREIIICVPLQKGGSGVWRNGQPSWPSARAALRKQRNSPRPAVFIISCLVSSNQPTQN